MKIAYFGHNAGDAAVRRRVVALQRDGFEVIGFMPRRGKIKEPPCRMIDLGETEDNAYLRRLLAIGNGTRKTLERKELLARCDVIIARNLDMLALAQLARWRAKLSMPIIYECLDIHTMLSGDGLKSRIMRRAEKALLKNTAMVVLSSPAFEREHFARYYPGRYKAFLVENRLIEGDEYGPRPVLRQGTRIPGRLRIGWYGNLRCARSLDLLLQLARTYPDRVEVHMCGYYAPGVFQDFESQIAPYDNVYFHGRYQAPQDLEEIYGEVDLVWAGDWYEDGANSLWLLPNRIYEGGYFGVPAMAPGETETARRLYETGGGFSVNAPHGPALAALIGQFLDDPAPIFEAHRRLLDLPETLFVEERGTMEEMISEAMI